MDFRASLKEVHRIAQLVSENLVSVAASLGHVHVPGRETSSGSTLRANEIEVGMGIHNEAGSQVIKSNLPGLVRILLAQLLDQDDEDRAFLHINPLQDTVVLLVNNLGGVSPLEMGGITTEVVRQLKKDYDLKPVRIMCGTCMTSLNGPGFSITLLRLASTDLGPGKDMLDLLAAPTQAVGWSGVLSPEIWNGEWEDVDNRAEDTNEGAEPSTLKSNDPYICCSVSIEC